MIMKEIPRATIDRLCTLYSFLKILKENNVCNISSRELGVKLSYTSYTIRKDINYLGELGPSPNGYPVNKLIELIENKLDLNQKRNVCIVGLGNIGIAILKYMDSFSHNFPIVAGFDKNINKLELIETSIPLYPTYEITNISKAKDIFLALVAVPADSFNDVCKKLENAGVKGIINFATTGQEQQLFLKDKKIWIKNFDILKEFRNLSSLIKLYNN